MELFMMDINFSRKAKPYQRNRMIADALWVIHGVLTNTDTKIAVDFPTMTKLSEGRKNIGHKVRLWSDSRDALNDLADDIYEKLTGRHKGDELFEIRREDGIQGYKLDDIDRWVSVQRIREKRPPKDGITPTFKRMAYERTIYLDSLPSIGMTSKSNGRDFTLFVDRIFAMPEEQTNTFLDGKVNAYGLSPMSNPVYVPDV